MVRDGERNVVIEYAGYATLTTTTVVVGLFGIACLLSTRSVRTMFGFEPNGPLLQRGKAPGNMLWIGNWIVSMIFAIALSNLVRSAARREPLPPLTSMFLLWVTMVYLFAFFGIRFLVEEFGMLEKKKKTESVMEQCHPAPVEKLKPRDKTEEVKAVFRLPDSVLVHISTMVELNDLLNFGATCSRLNSMVKSGLQSISSFTAPASANSGGQANSFFDLYTSTSSTISEGASIEENPYATVMEQRQRIPPPQLRDVHLGKIFNLFTQYGSFSLLSEVNLSQNYNLSDTALTQFLTTSAFSLKSLNLGCTNAADNVMKAISTFHSRTLRVCILDLCHAVSTRGFQTLFSACDGIVKVSLRETSACDECLQLLLENTSGRLEELDVSGCSKLTDRAMGLFATPGAVSRTIRVLTLDGCSSLSRATTIRVLCACENVRALSLRQTDFEDHLEVLSRELQPNPNLLLLDLSGTNLVDIDFFRIIPCVKNIRVGIFGATQITDESLNLMASHWQDLRHLELVGCDVTRIGLESIAASCKTLRALNLGNCSTIGDEDAVMIVKRMPNLQLLCLSGCDQISSKGAELINKLRPDLVLFFGYDRFQSRSHDYSNLQRAKFMLFQLLVGESLGIAMVLQATRANPWVVA